MKILTETFLLWWKWDLEFVCDDWGKLYWWLLVVSIRIIGLQKTQWKLNQTMKSMFTYNCMDGAVVFQVWLNQRSKSVFLWFPWPTLFCSLGVKGASIELSTRPHYDLCGPSHFILWSLFSMYTKNYITTEFV